MSEIIHPRFKSKEDVNTPIVKSYIDLYKLLEKPLNFVDCFEAYIFMEEITIEDYPNALLCFLRSTPDKKWVWVLSPDEKRGICFFDFKPEYDV